MACPRSSPLSRLRWRFYGHSAAVTASMRIDRRVIPLPLRVPKVLLDRGRRFSPADWAGHRRLVVRVVSFPGRRASRIRWPSLVTRYHVSEFRSPWADASPSGRTIDRASLKSTSSPSTRLLRADIGCFAGSAPTRRTASHPELDPLMVALRHHDSQLPAMHGGPTPHQPRAEGVHDERARPRQGPDTRWAPDSPPKAPGCTDGCISGRALLLCSSRRAEVPSVGAVRLAIADWTSCVEATEARGT